jgi:MYXO-CTERM domain-containing protein
LLLCLIYLGIYLGLSRQSAVTARCRLPTLGAAAVLAKFVFSPSAYYCGVLLLLAAALFLAKRRRRL